MSKCNNNSNNKMREFNKYTDDYFIDVTYKIFPKKHKIIN